MKGKIPNVPASVAPEYRRLLDALKETVEVGEGTVAIRCAVRSRLKT